MEVNAYRCPFCNLHFFIENKQNQEKNASCPSCETNVVDYLGNRTIDEPNISFTEREIEEISYIIGWAISEGYNTQKITRDVAHKLLSKEVMLDLDKNANIGIGLIDGKEWHLR